MRQQHLFKFLVMSLWCLVLPYQIFSQERSIPDIAGQKPDSESIDHSKFGIKAIGFLCGLPTEDEWKIIIPNIGLIFDLTPGITPNRFRLYAQLHYWRIREGHYQAADGKFTQTINMNLQLAYHFPIAEYSANIIGGVGYAVTGRRIPYRQYLLLIHSDPGTGSSTYFEARTDKPEFDFDMHPIIFWGGNKRLNKHWTASMELLAGRSINNINLGMLYYFGE